MIFSWHFFFVTDFVLVNITIVFFAPVDLDITIKWVVQLFRDFDIFNNFLNIFRCRVWLSHWIYFRYILFCIDCYLNKSKFFEIFFLIENLWYIIALLITPIKLIKPVTNLSPFPSGLVNPLQQLSFMFFHLLLTYRSLLSDQTNRDCRFCIIFCYHYSIVLC